MSALRERLANLGIVSQDCSSAGASVKTELLKDKRGHVYAIVALSDTTVDLKPLSARLGLGKGGIQPVPEATLSAILKSASQATFLGLADGVARDVVCLLDSRCSGQADLRVPSADDSEQITMSGADIEKFLRSLGSTVSIVDITASPKIDREHPPDLKQLADSAAVVEAVQQTAPPPAAAAPAPGGKKQPKPAAKSKQAAGGQSAALDVDRLVSSIVDKCSSVDSGKQSGREVSEAMRVLLADVRMELNSLRNAAYASGFAAARGAIRTQLESGGL